ncbi:hypothetical protein [Thermococcus sp. MV11]|uniref:hypothetical protein n=1 Tax=Thermococcus sp. MV11 TaxID=1638267 RepID=UPI00142F8055|nr:hypothetical protein [Thermococcus sp. MV11]NJE02976.1 hypothetical protein [Thermococcus sp. MV11]
MSTIMLRPPTLRKLEALGFSAVIVVIILLGTAVWGASYRFHEDLTLNPGEYYVYKIKGHSWSTVYLSIESTKPVTVCITDGTGIAMLKSGEGSLCFLKAERIRNLERLWRFPKNGPLYLVLLPDSDDGPVRVSLTVESGLVPW